MMYYYEIKNIKNNHCFTATAKSMKEACKAQGYKTHHCKCIYKAIV